MSEFFDFLDVRPPEPEVKFCNSCDFVSSCLLLKIMANHKIKVANNVPLVETFGCVKHSYFVDKPQNNEPRIIKREEQQREQIDLRDIDRRSFGMK